MRALVLSTLGALALIGTGCTVQAADPPEAAPTYTLPPIGPVSSQVPAAERASLPQLARDSLARKAKRLTVRIRNVGCQGVATGSGFALAHDVLVTNRHVLAGASVLEVSTWDGHTHEISAATVGALGDLGIAVVDGRLPVVGHFGRPPGAGNVVTAVGYPRGGPLRLSHGVVVDRIDGGQLGVPGAVVRITALVRHGNSGGPLLDNRGRIAGIVYAIERPTGLGLAIPVDTLRRLARIGGFEDVPPCGSE